MSKKGLVIVTNYILVFLVLFFFVAGAYWIGSFYEKKVEEQNKCVSYYADAYNLRKILISSVKSPYSEVNFVVSDAFSISGTMISFECGNFDYKVPLIVRSCRSYNLNPLINYTVSFNGSCVKLLAS